MKQGFVATRNARDLASALEHVRPGAGAFVLVKGAPGTGKTTAAACLGERISGVIYRVNEGTSHRALSSGLVNELNGHRVEFYQVERLYRRLLDDLERFGFPPIFLDEADRLQHKRHGVAAEKERLRPGSTARAASTSVGLLRAHDEVDRAHHDLYESGGHGDAWANAPERELLNKAISELQAFNLDKEDQTYERLLNGVLHAMCLLARVAPPYADIKD